VQIPSPSLVVLIGPVASGKSTWASQHFAPAQIISSDALRAVVGESEHDLRASTDAFAVLDDIVSRRLQRRLTTVIDTLGLDPDLRVRWRQLARSAGMPCVAVVFDTAPAECRRRNSARPVAVPADVVANQLRRWPATREAVGAEPWDALHAPQPVVVVPAALTARRRGPDPTVATTIVPSLPDNFTAGIRVGLHLSSFDWTGGRERLSEHLRAIAVDAEAAGVDQLWMMDHLRQIPQVGASWADLPEPYTTLSWLAAVTERVRLGVLVSPAFRHHPAVLAKQIATLDVLSAGRAMCGLGVGWFAQEHLAAGIDFPSLDRRYAHLDDALQALPLLWGKGSPRFEGTTVTIGEALCYPRPLQARIPIVVGGSGERRTLRLVARHADGCNLFGEPTVVARKVAALARHCDGIGRDTNEIDISHLSTVLIGADRQSLATTIDRLRPKRMGAERYAREINAGTIDDHYERAMRLLEVGVTTLIVRLIDVAEPGAVERLGMLIDRLRSS
jgi:alkanesulfonate monooxygenase SsuD/methylene tetrahydromethanopterin reductase-like flavin-dependent oxidoreductase (luciferase family)/predicted kinase